MSKHLGCCLLLILMIAGKLNVAYPAPQTDSLKLWTVDLPYRSPLIKGHEDKIAPVKGNFVLTTMIQIKKIKEGVTNEPPPPPDFFLNLFQRSEKGDDLYALKNYQIITTRPIGFLTLNFPPTAQKYFSRMAGLGIEMEHISCIYSTPKRKSCNLAHQN